jgi:hypothetical protein
MSKQQTFFIVLVRRDQASLGTLDTASPSPTAPPLTQTVKFDFRSSAKSPCLRGWLSLFTVALPRPAFDAELSEIAVT